MRPNTNTTAKTTSIATAILSKTDATENMAVKNPRRTKAVPIATAARNGQSIIILSVLKLE